jgi:hypothetical protein
LQGIIGPGARGGVSMDQEIEGKLMSVKIDNNGPNIFPTVDFLDAQAKGEHLGLIFGTRVEDQPSRVLIRITREQWHALASVVDSILKG